MVCEENGQLINRQRRLDCWTKYFYQQISWELANVIPWTLKTANGSKISLDPPMELELESRIRLLKQEKLTSPDELFPVLLRPGGDISTKTIMFLLCGIWNAGHFLLSWVESLVLFIFKKMFMGIPTFTKVSTSRTGRRLTSAHESDIREQQAELSPRSRLYRPDFYSPLVI